MPNNGRRKTEAIVQTLKEGDVDDDTCGTAQNKEE